MLHSHHKAHRLQADVMRQAEALATIATMAQSGSKRAATGN
ncbi:hypothetical protein OKW28_004357 [Paraburkholderia sp. 40]